MSEEGRAEKFRTERKESEGPIGRFFDRVAAAMAPLIPALLGGGLVRVLLSLLTVTGILSPLSGTYAILAVMADAIFFFLPIFVANTAAGQFRASPILSMLIAAILFSPALETIFAGGDGDFIGLPIPASVYTGNLFAVFLLVPLVGYLERVAHRLFPGGMRLFLAPFFVLFVCAPLTLIVLAPLGRLAGEIAFSFFTRLYATADWAAVALLSALVPFFSFFGMLPALIPLGSFGLIVADPTLDPLFFVACFCALLAQGGASFAVSAAAKDKRTRTLAASAGAIAILSGRPAPAFYGVTLREKKSLSAACLGAGAAGLCASLAGLAVPAGREAPSLFSLFDLRTQDGTTTLLWWLVILAIAFLLPFVLTLLFLRRQQGEEKLSTAPAVSGEPFAAPPADARPAAVITEETVLAVVSPLCGRVIPLARVEEENALTLPGKGIAVMPTDGHLYAPVSGTITRILEEKNALTLVTREGQTVFLHVGLDTSSLEGRYFTVHRQEKEEVRAGDLLLSFDLDAIDKEGYDLTTPILVSDLDGSASLVPTEKETVIAGDPLFTLRFPDKHRG